VKVVGIGLNQGWMSIGQPGCLTLTEGWPTTHAAN